ncbi:hypothetical protein [Sphingomonas sp. LT1P40]|uniref:hypothetical protein n=1 Tax=Alteristakelama amylovorans TaxID=3096166 RepID=UPI002FC5D9B0
MITMSLAEIATLGTQIATHGAIRASEMVSDDIFELMIAIAILVYETYPGTNQ